MPPLFWTHFSPFPWTAFPLLCQIHLSPCSLQQPFPSLSLHPTPSNPQPLSSTLLCLAWLCWKLCWAQTLSYFRLLMRLGTPGGWMNFRFPGLHCRNTGSPLEGCFFSPLRQLRACFIGPEHPLEQQKCPFTWGFFIYSKDGSTMALPRQLQPAKAIWPKAEAGSARMVWESSIESLGICACGWSEEQLTDNWEELLRAFQGDAAANAIGKGGGSRLREEPFHKHRAWGGLSTSPSAQQMCGELGRATWARGAEQGMSHPRCHQERLSHTHTPWDSPVSPGWDSGEPKVPRFAHHLRRSVSLALHWGLGACRKSWCEMLWRC